MSSYALTPEQNCFLKMAKMVWKRRGVAKALKLSFQEESATETMLQDLALEFPGHLTIVQFNKAQEATTGADWAWALLSADGSHSLSLLVQAKVLDLKDKKYTSIQQTIGGKAGAPAQIDVLLAHSKTTGMIPLYAFYNHLSDPTQIPDTCGTLPKTAPTFPDDCWGVSLALATDVKASLPDKTFSTHKDHSIPMHCLLCSGASGQRRSGGSPEMALRRLLQMEEGQFSRASGRPPRSDIASLLLSVAGERFESLDDGHGRWRTLDEVLRQPLPQVFTAAQEFAQMENDEAREQALDTFAREYPNLAGVVIMTDAPERMKDRRD